MIARLKPAVVSGPPKAEVVSSNLAGCAKFLTFSDERADNDGHRRPRFATRGQIPWGKGWGNCSSAVLFPTQRRRASP